MRPEWLLVSKPVRPPFRDGSTVLARDLVRGLDPSIRLRYFGDPALPLRENGQVLEAESMGYAPGLVAKARVLAAILAHRALPLHMLFTPGPLTSTIVAALRRLQPSRTIVQTLTSSAGAGRLARQLRHLDAVVVHSEHTRELLLQAGLDPGRVRRIYPGVALADPIADPASNRRLLYAGDLDAGVVPRLRQLAHALHARPELADWSLTIATRPKSAPGEDARRALHSELLAVRQVEILGEVTDMDALYRRCSLQVFCAEHVDRKVDIPLVLLEGCARGLPLITLDVAPPREVFERARSHGLEPGVAVDASGLVDAVAQAAADPDRLRGWGRDAAALVKQEFSLQRMLDAYAALYRELELRS